MAEQDATTEPEWETYDPCPACGSTRYVERVVAFAHSTSSDGEKDYFDLDHIGEALDIWCAECDEHLRDAHKDERRFFRRT